MSSASMSSYQSSMPPFVAAAASINLIVTPKTWEVLYNDSTLSELIEAKWPIDLLGKKAKELSCSSACEEFREHFDDTLIHKQEVAFLSIILGLRLGLNEEKLKRLYMAALFHDIGKFSTKNPKLLFKRGNFTKQEFDEVIRPHPRKSYDIICEIFPGSLGRIIAKIALQHHEKPDGTGYPEGLHGGDILEEAAILRGADGLNAMTRDRCHRKGMRIELALKILAEGKETSHDPNVVDTIRQLTKTALFPKLNDSGTIMYIKGILQENAPTAQIPSKYDYRHQARAPHYAPDASAF